MNKHQYQDLTGERFGRLLVIKRQGKDRHGNAKWLCECDCGGITNPSTVRLKSGTTKSCGCLHREIMKKGVRRGTKSKPHTTPRPSSVKRNLHKRYGKLTITGVFIRGGKQHFKYRCDCGNTGEAKSKSIQKRRGGCDCGCVAAKRIKATAIKRLMTVLVSKKATPITIAENRKRTVIKQKHKYDNHKVDGGTVLWHAAVEVDRDMRAKNHLYYCKCRCGKYFVNSGNNIRNNNINCPKCLKRKQRISGLKGNYSSKRDRAARRRENTRRKYERRGRKDTKSLRKKCLMKHYKSCHTCGKTKYPLRKMHIHHLWSYTQYYKYAYTLSNTVLLCEDCHMRFHAEYGQEGFSPLDYWAFRARTLTCSGG